VSTDRRHENGSVRNALRWVALALLVGCATVLTGCSPPNRVNSAVYLRDGKPTVVVHLCSSKDRLTGLNLRETDAKPPGSGPSAAGPSGSTQSGSAAPRQYRAWQVGASGSAGYAEIRLLDTPPGWTVYTSPENLLSQLRDDATYRVFVDYTGPGGGDDSGVTFTLGDLRSLGSGEVWSRPKPYDREVPMTLAAFRRAAKASC
jgi:hypothetical protein